MSTWETIKEDLNHEELVELLLAYDNYIQAANYEKICVEGRKIVTIPKFYDKHYRLTEDEN